MSECVRPCHGNSSAWKPPMLPMLLPPYVSASVPKFAAHKEQLLSRMRVHPRVKHPQIRELLPFVARHFVQERALPVDDLIVAEHENEMLLERIHEREGDVVVVKASEDRIER